VKLSNGAQESYALNSYVVTEGDQYVFTAHLGKWNVPVTTTVVDNNGSLECDSIVGTLSRDPV
jgi:hypothetical protein